MTDITLKLDTKKLDQLDKDVPGRADQIVRKLAFDWVRIARDNMSSTSPSAPGEPPGVVTGTLKNSINAEPVKPGTWKLHDGTEYGAAQEFGTLTLPARPWFEPALREVADSAPEELKAVVNLG